MVAHPGAVVHRDFTAPAAIDPAGADGIGRRAVHGAEEPPWLQRSPAAAAGAAAGERPALAPVLAGTDGCGAEVAPIRAQFLPRAPALPPAKDHSATDHQTGTDRDEGVR